MNINCPHCGTEYDIDKSEYGRFVKCEICGKGFVAGTSAAKKLGEAANAARDAVKVAANTAYERAKNIDWKAQQERAKATANAIFDKGRILWAFMQRKFGEKNWSEMINNQNPMTRILIAGGCLIILLIFVFALFGKNNEVIDKNPLSLFKFGDAPKQRLSGRQGGTIQYKVKDFLGIQSMTLGYTKKNSLYSICFVSENDHYSAAESDVRVSKLMQLCDELCNGIKWKIGTQEHDGRKFAIGRLNNTYSIGWVDGHETKNYNYMDMVFSIIPTRGEKNVVGLQVNLIDNKRRRLESDYLDFDIRYPIKISDSQYREKKEWLREQLASHGLEEYHFKRNYECGKLYAYDYAVKKCIYTDREYVGYIYIKLDNGVLKVSGDLAIDEAYAEKIIVAKLMTFNEEFKGIEGEINDYRHKDSFGPCGDILLPCPVCHGEAKHRKGMCSCGAGLISIGQKEFRREFEKYKIRYKNGQKL